MEIAENFVLCNMIIAAFSAAALSIIRFAILAASIIGAELSGLSLYTWTPGTHIRKRIDLLKVITTKGGDLTIMSCTLACLLSSSYETIHIAIMTHTIILLAFLGYRLLMQFFLAYEIIKTCKKHLPAHNYFRIVTTEDICWIESSCKGTAYRTVLKSNTGHVAVHHSYLTSI